MKEIALPHIRGLVEARNVLRSHYDHVLRQRNSDNVKLHFTLDGNLVGDVGEGIAAEYFGIILVDAKSTIGIDGYAPDGVTTVQVKATGTGRGPAFRKTEVRADYLLFFEIDFEKSVARIIFNGPEFYATSKLPAEFKNQRMLSPKAIREANAKVPDNARLPLLK